MSKQVSFKEPLVTQEHLEPPELAQDLAASRKNNLFQWKADLLRYSKIITPILLQKHRQKVLKSCLYKFPTN